MSARELALLALHTLDTQAAYFRTREHALLVRSKELEAQLRREATETLSAQTKFNFEKESTC